MNWIKKRKEKSKNGIIIWVLQCEFWIDVSQTKKKTSTTKYWIELVCIHLMINLNIYTENKYFNGISFSLFFLNCCLICISFQYSSEVFDFDPHALKWKEMRKGGHWHWQWRRLRKTMEISKFVRFTFVATWMIYKFVAFSH